MDLEKLNNDYLRLKVATEKFKTILEQYENDLKLAEKDKETAENNLKVATKPAEKKKYQAELNKAIINIDYIKIQIETAKNQQQKVQEDITKRVSMATVVKMNSHMDKSDRTITSWLGASILTSLGTFVQWCVSKEDYEEHGPVVIERKCA